MKLSPRPTHRAAIFLLVALQVGGAASWAQTTSTPDNPEATRKALTALLAAANDPIPRSSSCYGAYGQPGPATVKDLLAMRMAYLYAGANVIKGHCQQAQQCTVSIWHAAGEDVASASITFAVKAGKAQVATLQCLITP